MFTMQPSMLDAGACIPRHCHAEPYATLVLEGAYGEVGDAGRLNVSSGDVLFHGPFSTHLDYVSPRKTVVLDFPLPLGTGEHPALCRVANPDALVRLAATNAPAAIELLLDSSQPVASAPMDLPDLLAEALRSDDPPRITKWAEENGYSREYVSRQFQTAYGVAPARYRAQAQARRAWRMIFDGTGSFASIAAALGYADQAHMARSIKADTGRTPGEWRSTANRDATSTSVT